jgi:hypothetical protein
MPPQVSLPSFFSFAASLHCSHSMWTVESHVHGWANFGPALIVGPSPNSWVRPKIKKISFRILWIGPALMVGPSLNSWVRPKIKKFPFEYCNFFLFVFFTKFCLISVYILHRKNTKSGIKMPGFSQNFQNTKKN